jgi:hypothetical protein
MDPTEKKILDIFRSSYSEATGIVEPRFRDDSDHPDAEPCLGCGHELGAHHGSEGESRCGEDGCGCKAGDYRSRHHYSADDDTAGTDDHNRRV